MQLASQRDDLESICKKRKLHRLSCDRVLFESHFKRFRLCAAHQCDAVGQPAPLRRHLSEIVFERECVSKMDGIGSPTNGVEMAVIMPRTPGEDDAELEKEVPKAHHANHACIHAYHAFFSALTSHTCLYRTLLASSAWIPMCTRATRSYSAISATWQCISHATI